jgi:putative membrane protein (TIGR04086 family)
VLAALNFGALMIGVAAGSLTASLLALVMGGLLTVLGLESGPDVGLVVGIVAGLVVGGWLAGLRSVHSHRFHGMVTGLLMAFVIVVVARLGGSPASTLSVIWLALVSVVVAGLGGWLGGRRRTRPR